MRGSAPTTRRGGDAASSSSLRAHRAKLLDGASTRATRFARTRGRSKTLSHAQTRRPPPPSADARAAYPMNATIAALLRRARSRGRCGRTIKTGRGWCLATSRRGVTVKPLEVLARRRRRERRRRRRRDEDGGGSTAHRARVSDETSRWIGDHGAPDVRARRRGRRGEKKRALRTRRRC